MVFSSLVFLFRFMPIVFGLYYICPKKLKNTFLLVASLFFYSWGEPKYLPLIILTVIKDYLVGRMIEKNRGNTGKMKLWLLVSILTNMGALAYFKYTDFFINTLNTILEINIGLRKLLLPVGISFYTFQSQSYTIDVYRGDCKAEKSLINYGTYVTLFPQLVAGPIVTYIDVQKELNHRTINLKDIQSGIFVFIMGLGSKVLLANNLGEVWKELEAVNFVGISTPLAWLGLIFYGLQIYFDFSGYSLMAIGMGKMLGFNFPENFNYPYMSKSITEFWRRWHITLGSWFREYVYFPMGGSRVSNGRHYFNLFVVWALTGLWHGPNWNFVLWGLFFFVLLCIEKAFLLKKLNNSKSIAHIYVLFFVTISWGLFAITDFSLLKDYLIMLFSFKGGMDWLYPVRNYGVLLIVSIFFATPISKNVMGKIKEHREIIGSIVGGIILIFSIAYLVDSSYNPFLYFRF